MANQFTPAEYLKLKDGTNLLLRPTNCVRYGLEPYCNSIQEFTYGVDIGINKKIGYEPEIVNGKNKNWYTCQVNLKDGWNSDVRRITRTINTVSGWLERLANISPSVGMIFASISCLSTPEYLKILCPSVPLVFFKISVRLVLGII